jgi:hypothetical protein
MPYSDQRTILPSGLLSSAPAPAYVPGQVDMSFLNNSAQKPPPDWVNSDKELQRQKDIQQQQLDLQKESIQNAKDMSDKQLALSYQQYVLSVQNSNKKSGKVICTKFHDLGYMDDDIFVGDQLYGEMMFIQDADYQEWYQSVASWYIQRMLGYTWGSILFIKLLWLFVNPISKELSYRSGHTKTKNWFGSFYLGCIRGYYLLFKKAKSSYEYE